MTKSDVLNLIRLSINVLRQGTLSKLKLFQQLFFTEAFCLAVFLFLFFTQSPYSEIFSWVVIVCGVSTVLSAFIMFKFHNGEKIKKLFNLEETVGSTINPSPEKLEHWVKEVHFILNTKHE